MRRTCCADYRRVAISGRLNTLASATQDQCNDELPFIDDLSLTVAHAASIYKLTRSGRFPRRPRCGVFPIYSAAIRAETVPRAFFQKRQRLFLVHAHKLQALFRKFDTWIDPGVQARLPVKRIGQRDVVAEIG